ncbi:hypothetical protein CDL12_30268 [Handroanthus impetiginosus]|uniref:Uncharacterized protein n=1 Tax=Handroanthus impetiginosus TaxID=429701 RepID=A0A2G9FW33_9LAMI|nr:hypothetical protein CDL12_30268 [Handroanthus impetiginosus]
MIEGSRAFLLVHQDPPRERLALLILLHLLLILTRIVIILISCSVLLSIQSFPVSYVSFWGHFSSWCSLICRSLIWCKTVCTSIKHAVSQTCCSL